MIRQKKLGGQRFSADHLPSENFFDEDYSPGLIHDLRPF